MDQKKVELITKLNADYWNQRYETEQTGWDIGYSNPALIEFVLSGVSKDAKILIPGLGNGYEMEDLWKKGYKQVYGMDLSNLAKGNFLNRVEDFPEDHYLVGDFFKLDQQFDLILEQTFFCALDPKLRPEYVKKMSEVLKPGGILAGVMFNFEKFDGPPFGGSEAEYRRLFEGKFDIAKLEDCRNSIGPRQGSEYFIKFIKNN